MIMVTWLPHWNAYAVRWNNRIIGMVRFRYPVPFRDVAEFNFA